MWPRSTLGELAGTGQYGLNAAALKEGQGVRFIRITDIDESGHIGGTDPAYVDATIRDLDRYELTCGDVLIARSGATAGKSLLFRGLPGRAVFAGYLIRFRPRQDRVLPEYLAYFLQSSAYWQFIHVTARVAAQPNVNARELASLPLPLAPIADQRRIVDLLSRAESIVRMRREAEAKANEIIPALFLDMFGDPARNERGWDTVQLDTLIRETKLGMVRGSRDLSNEFRLPYLRMDSVSDGTILAKQLKRTDASPAEEQAYALAIGDFLFNTRNSRELVGKTALVRHLPEPVTLFNNNLMRVRFDGTRAAPEFVADQFQTRFVQDQLESIKRGTTSVFAIYFKDLKTVKLRLPPIQVQRDFARRCDRLYELREPQREATDLAERTFQSLLAGVFGE